MIQQRLRTTVQVRPLLFLFAAAAFGALVLFPATAEAHERRDVNGGSHQFVVGFMSEPAFEGQQNGIDLRITQGNDEPVEGLEHVLQVEVTHNESGVSAVLPLRALWGEPGRYQADLVPTASGGYEFRFFGVIDGAEVDETFLSRSLGGGFNDVEPLTAIQFPETVASGRELQGAVAGAQSELLAAQDAAATARTLAIAGIALGLIGLAAGAGGLALALRRQ
jgi:hypothetical protein